MSVELDSESWLPLVESYFVYNFVQRGLLETSDSCRAVAYEGHPRRSLSFGSLRIELPVTRIAELKKTKKSESC